MSRKILVAGMGNILRGDDGFGVEVAQQLVGSATLPDSVKVIDVGIGGIHLVHELMGGYEMLVIIDAIERGSVPGTIHLMEAEVPDLVDWPQEKREGFLADTHYATPSKAMILAKALGVLPSKVFIIGCQPAAYEDLGLGLSGSVQAAIPAVINQIRGLVAQLEQKDGQ
jgi:hydrogenase maturation protease